MSVENIPGLVLLKSHLTCNEIQHLKTNLANSVWSNELTRRVQHYGYQYHYSTRTVSKVDHGIPTYLSEILDRLVAEKVITQQPNQLIINEYKKGQCISKHIDAPVFGPEIFSISLGTSAKFILRKGIEVVSVQLDEGDVLVLRDDARYLWTHELAPLSGLRVSFTFRTVV